MTACAICGGVLRQPDRGRRRQYCSRSCQARAYRARRRAPAAPPRPRPQRLSKLVIAHAAVALADRAGTDGLTMRRLAGELGVATAALYRYFDDRAQLLVAMTDLVLAETPPPPPHLVDRRARIRYEAQQEWQIYRRHPWILTVLARIRPPLGLSLFDTLERTLSALDAPDMSRTQLISTYLSYSALVQGLALVWTAERSDRIGGPEAAAEVPAEVAALVDPVTRPALYKAFGPTGPPPDLDFDELLTDAVDMLLDGVAVRRAGSTE
ncbi:TetR/AcrR family transcriptional regulator [Nocardia fusca]|uniref:TetR/AcrR family transcriptional regulator n=1 Tax=Nocardia fusca TaxID=941183 RepID=UPI0007A732F3|nr:helix-turn-helix domain-containing protein [Nocardia fusca]